MTSKELCKLFEHNLDFEITSSRVGSSSFFFNQHFVGGKFIIAIPFVTSAGNYSIRKNIILYIAHDKVEAILSKLYAEYKIGFNNYTVYKSLQLPAMVELVELNSSRAVEQVIPFIKDQIAMHGIPFFEEFKFFTSILTEVNQMKQDDLHRFIYPPHMIRILILLKLINSERYNAYREEVIGWYTEHAQGEFAASLLPIFNMLPELIEYLDQQ